MSLEDLRGYFRQTVLSDSPRRILIQVRGERWQADPFAAFVGATVVTSVEGFHATMPTQPLN